MDARQFKMIVSDLDGTLKDIHAPLHPELPKIIAELEGAGMRFTIATGKNLHSTRDTARELGISHPLILSNGCVIQTLEGRVIKNSRLPAEFVEQLIAVCDAMHIELAIHIGEEIYVREITKNVSILFEYGAPALVEVGEWSNIGDLLPNAYKCISIDRQDRQRLFALEQGIFELAGSSVEYCHTLVEMLEFMPQGVSKVSGIQVLAEMYQVGMDGIIAIGDGNNDIGMLEACGFGVATENAPAAVREAADIVIPSCEDAGPVEFFRELIKMREASHDGQD